MVAEVKLESGDWVAFSSERIPQAWDDAVKGRCATISMASQTLTSDALKDIIPVAFPITRNARGRELIAKDPVGTWTEMGQPCFSAVSWCKVATRVADNGLENLHKVMSAAKIELARFPRDQARPDGTEVFASSSTASSTPRGAGSGAGQS